MSMVRAAGWVLTALGLFVAAPHPATAEKPLGIIPAPATCLVQAGHFKFIDTTRILVDPSSTDAQAVGDYLAARVMVEAGLSLSVSPLESTPTPRHAIVLTQQHAPADLGAEGYALTITSATITIRAPKAVGLFYGVQSLLQLLPPKTNFMKRSAPPRLPCAQITDRPRFPWRGLMLDCSRTYLSEDYLKRYLDLLASYKMNVLHLHFTDDQGWRPQIDSHPKLTEVGSNFDPAYGKEVNGYYTKDALRRLVQYAAERHITLVPELEMPAHCLAALTAYPDLSCRHEAYRILPYIPMGETQPIPPSTPYGVFCAGNEDTFKVLEDALSEIIDIFPSPLIHIGGDECPKEFWHTCPKCQARMKNEGLKNEDELQSYFVKRIEKFILSKNRKLIGWDEILEGGLAPEATVMSWRGMKGGIEAARQGHDVVMTPTSHCYFDYPYTVTSLEKTYSFDPIPQELTPEQAVHILGVQANMWTHIARTEADIDEMIFPRLIALSEVGWSPAQQRNWDDFQSRMQAQYPRLDARGVHYYVEPPTQSITDFAVSPDGAFGFVQDQVLHLFTDGRWEAAPGKLRAVALGANGQRWALGAKARAGNYALLQWTGRAWKKLSGAPGAVQICLAPNGVLWTVDKTGLIRTYANGTWRAMPGQAHQIAIGANGEVWALAVSTLAGGYDIQHWDGAQWHILGNNAAAVEIAADADGALWAVNDSKTTWKYVNKAWTIIPGQLTDIAADAKGAVYGLISSADQRTWDICAWDEAQWLMKASIPSNPSSPKPSAMK